MRKYLVTLECNTLNSTEVEAENKEEAIELAKIKLRGMCESNGMEFYEIELIKGTL